jgi:hypothetical protein
VVLRLRCSSPGRRPYVTQGKGLGSECVGQAQLRQNAGFDWPALYSLTGHQPCDQRSEGKPRGSGGLPDALTRLAPLPIW